MEKERDIQRWQQYVKSNQEEIAYYQKRIDDAGGKATKYTWKEKIRIIKEVLKK